MNKLDVNKILQLDEYLTLSITSSYVGVASKHSISIGNAIFTKMEPILLEVTQVGDSFSIQVESGSISDILESNNEDITNFIINNIINKIRTKPHYKVANISGGSL